MRALVIGNIVLDETFAVAALPRAGETLLASGVAADLGGKGANQAVVLARCGLSTRLVARIGGDAAAARVLALLAPEPLDTHGIGATDLPTDRSIVLRADDGDNCIVSTAACAHALGEADVVAALRGADPDTMLVLQGNLSRAATTRALHEARARGLPTVFTPAPTAPWYPALWPLLDLVVLNAGEARVLTGRDDPAEAARDILAAGAGRVAVTLGGAGALLWDGERIARVSAAPATVCDTTGAGDTFTSVLAAGLLARGLGVPAALTAAARAAALTVSRAGTFASLPTRQELAAILAPS